MSAESTLHLAQGGVIPTSDPSAVVASESVDSAVDKAAAPSCSCPSAVVPSALEEQNRQLVAQMQMLQQRVEQLEQLVEEMAARPSVGTSTIRVGALCSVRQQLSSSLPTQFSPAHRLHKDALHCVLAYLSLEELPFAMRSCRAWYAAVHSMPPQNAFFCISVPRRRCQLLMSPSSPLIRHIVKCEIWNACSADDLALFLACLPRLQSLSHRACTLPEPCSQLYSSQLRELHVNLAREFYYDDALFAQMENLRSASGLRSLTLTLPDDVYDIESFSLEPIECMKELKSLTLLNGDVLSSKQLVPIRRLPSLRTLSFGGWFNGQVEALVEHREDCPQLKLHHFDRLDDVDFDLKETQLLVRMPTLQRVEPRYITPAALKLLADGLPDLHTLTVDIQPRDMDGSLICDWPLVRASLASCHQLTALTLESTPLEELCDLLLALPPSMRRIDLRYCDDFLNSESFFQCVSKGGLRHLEQFHFWLDLDVEDEDHNCNMYTDAERWYARQRACAPWIDAHLNLVRAEP
jgi:hypothetical protein